MPIPVFECAVCGETVATPETFSAVEELFATEGADAWFTKEPSEYLPAGTACGRCGSTELKPETDIVDVWFESGCRTRACSRRVPSCRRPADLYLEGSDQHRGWFQSSLLTSVGAYGQAPFDRVLTHGFIVDGNGRKMSKSLGNVVSPLDIIKKSGADIIRLWVASADYGQDVSVSDEIIDRTARRTAASATRSGSCSPTSTTSTRRPTRCRLPRCPSSTATRMTQLANVLADVTKAYDEWRFHVVFRTIYDYVGDLSGVYLDVLKDRLYADAPDSVSRRSAQTVLSAILGVLVRVLAPILSFTAEETWQYMPEALRDAESVHLSDWPVLDSCGRRRARGVVRVGDRRA